MNRDEFEAKFKDVGGAWLAKAREFCAEWWASIGDFWSYHAATASLAIVAYAIARFFVS